MNNILKLLFKRYNSEDIAGAYIHYGVGYTGMDIIDYVDGRVIHNGVGYNGL